MVHIGIVGVTITGNLGGASMLYAALDALRPAFPDCRFDLLSVSPAADRQARRPPDVQVVPAPPWLLVGVCLPAALFARPLARSAAGRRVLGLLPAFRSLLACDAVIDLSGIAFSDGRGWPVLLYNAAVCGPALLFRRRVFKLSQALGPFRERANAWLAARLLPRCDTVVGRGDASGRHLAELGLPRFDVLPDTAFALEVTDEARAAADRILAACAPAPPRVFVTPSRVVERLCAARGLDYAGSLAGFVDDLAREGRAPALLPHCDSAARGRNDDRAVCRRILAALPPGRRVPCLDGDGDPRTLRALIARADLLVCSRFHAMVSALATATPALVVGWGHKYREVLATFGQEDGLLDWTECSREALGARFRALAARAEETRSRLRARLPEVVRQARLNFAPVIAALRRGGAA